MRKNIILVVVTILIVAFCSGCSDTYKHLSVEEAMNMMKTAKNYIIVDVRSQEEYDKRHIPGALLVPINDLKAGKFDALPDKNQTLMIYCWTGRRAETAAQILIDNGYTNVYELGGLVNWTGETEGEEE